MTVTKEVPMPTANTPYLFINYLIENTCHTLSSLSQILEIPERRLVSAEELTQYDEMKIKFLHELCSQ